VTPANENIAAPPPVNVDLRSWLAGMAFAGLLAAPDLDLDLATLAQHALDAADVMQGALDKRRVA
jgi:hypothetical protein